jgi:hypothetical protein
LRRKTGIFAPLENNWAFIRCPYFEKEGPELGRKELSAFVPLSGLLDV